MKSIDLRGKNLRDKTISDTYLKAIALELLDLKSAELYLKVMFDDGIRVFRRVQ